MQLPPGPCGRSGTLSLPRVSVGRGRVGQHPLDLSGGSADGSGTRSRRRLRGRRHDVELRPARRTSDRRGEEDRTALCAQRHRPRTFVRLQGLGLRASYAFRRRAADARRGQRPACRTGCAGGVDAVARGAGRAGRQGVRRPRLYAPAAVHAQRTACGLAGAHHGPHRAGRRAGRDSRPVRRVGAELLLPVAGEPHGGRLGGRDGFRDAALGAAQRLAVQLLHRTGHLDLRSGRVGRSLVGDGPSARLPLRVEGRGDHPRGAETERRGEDLPRSERPDPVGRPARRGACGDLPALGGQTRSDGDDGDPDRRRHEKQDSRDRSGGRRGR